MSGATDRAQAAKDAGEKALQLALTERQKQLKKNGLTRTYYLKKLKELSSSENEHISLKSVIEVIKLWGDYPAEKREITGKNGGPIEHEHEHTIHKELAERLEDME